MWEAYIGGSRSETGQGKTTRVCPKLTKRERARCMAEVEQHQLSKFKTQYYTKIRRLQKLEKVKSQNTSKNISWIECYLVTKMIINKIFETYIFTVNISEEIFKCMPFVARVHCKCNTCLI
jgi:hypothetical protein